MIFEKDSWGNLIFVSTMDTWRNKSQISDSWDLVISGGPLYQKNANRDIKKYTKNLLEKRGDTYYAFLKSDEFKDKLESYLKNKANSLNDDISSKLYFMVLDNIDQFIKIINNRKTRNDIFNIENIKDLYEKDPEKAKSKPFLIFDSLLSSYTLIFMEEMLKGQGVLGENIVNVFKETLLNNVEGNMRPLMTAVNKDYENNPEKYDLLYDSLSDITKDQIPG